MTNIHEKHEVLNKGYIRLVDHMGDDLSIVRSARVSYDAELRSGEDEGKDAKLINYLMKNKHTSPFESVTLTVEVKLPIFAARQWHRHRTWCLAGDSELEFIRPCDGKPYKKKISDVEASWNPKKADSSRVRQALLSLEEHNRGRIKSMKLRCMGLDGAIEETSIVDIWKSGVKKIYKVTAGGCSIRASADHLFHSDGGWVRVADLRGRNVTVIHRGGKISVEQRPPILTNEELLSEQWVEFQDGYRVSNLGRVQTKWGQGARTKKQDWLDKAVTVNSSGRAVIGIRSIGVVQVSRLVAKAFLAGAGPIVRHLDDNALDNRVSNLAWGDDDSNRADSVRNGTISSRKWVSLPVESIVEDGEEVVYDLTVDHPAHNFVASKFLVHNCYNETSARYSVLPDDYYIPEVSQITSQSKANKQQRTDEILPNAEVLQDAISSSCEQAYSLYTKLIRDGCPRELARGVLPVNMYTHMFATVNLLNLYKFIGLRSHPHAQYEIMVYSDKLLLIAEQIAPIATAAFREHWLGL